LDTLHEITDRQTVEFGHQRALELFTTDVQSATWFYNGETHSPSGDLILRDTPNPYVLILGYDGPDGEEVWVKYGTRVGVLSGETYLTRTAVIGSVDQGMSLLSTGVANLEFTYFDQDGNITSKLTEVRKIQMTLSVNVGGATVQRIYEASMRNPNLGLRTPTVDFEEIETTELRK